MRIAICVAALVVAVSTANALEILAGDGSYGGSCNFCSTVGLESCGFNPHNYLTIHGDNFEVSQVRVEHWGGYIERSGERDPVAMWNPWAMGSFPGCGLVFTAGGQEDPTYSSRSDSCESNDEWEAVQPERFTGPRIFRRKADAGPIVFKDDAVLAFHFDFYGNVNAPVSVQSGGGPFWSGQHEVGVYLTVKSKCEGAAPEGCVECAGDGPVRCNRCAVGFQLYDGVCKPCPEGCEFCKGGEERCFWCRSGEPNEQGQCKPAEVNPRAPEEWYAATSYADDFGGFSRVAAGEPPGESACNSDNWETAVAYKLNPHKLQATKIAIPDISGGGNGVTLRPQGEAEGAEQSESPFYPWANHVVGLAVAPELDGHVVAQFSALEVGPFFQWGGTRTTGWSTIDRYTAQPLELGRHIAPPIPITGLAFRPNDDDCYDGPCASYWWDVYGGRLAAWVPECFSGCCQNSPCCFGPVPVTIGHPFLQSLMSPSFSITPGDRVFVAGYSDAGEDRRYQRLVEVGMSNLGAQAGEPINPYTGRSMPAGAADATSWIRTCGFIPYIVYYPEDGFTANYPFTGLSFYTATDAFAVHYEGDGEDAKSYLVAIKVDLDNLRWRSREIGEIKGLRYINDEDNLIYATRRLTSITPASCGPVGANVNSEVRSKWQESRDEEQRFTFGPEICQCFL